MLSSNKITFLIILHLIFAELFLCNQVVYNYTSNDISSLFLSTDDTLAIVDKKAITVSEFIKLYKDKLVKLGITDNYDLRLKYLLNLVNDELLIAEAKFRKLDKTNLAKKELNRIKIQELLNAFTTKYISPQINVTEDDLKDLFIKLNTKIKVSHLYSPTKEKADSLYNELLKGKSFEELAKENFNDPILKENGGSLGYISIDEMDPNFESAAYSMQIGEISKPVKTVKGYSIIRVEDIKQNPFTTESEFLKAHDRLKAFARKRTFENAAKQFSNSLRKKLNVKFREDALSKLYDAIKKSSLDNLIENPSGISSNDLSKFVVSSNLGNWSIETVIKELSDVPDKQRKWIHTKENLEDFIAGLINRKYIIQLAKKEKLDTTLSYKKNVEFNFDTYLLNTIENELKNQIKIYPDSIKSYYEKNINYFKTKPQMRLSSILLDDSTIVDSIKHFLEIGIPFEELAKKYSIQKIIAQRGGDLGYFTKEELGEFGNKIFSLNVGKWIGPLVYDGKYLFVKCTDFKKSEIRTFQETYEQIKKLLLTLNWLNYRDKFTASLKEKFTYKLFVQKLKELKL